MKYKIGILVEDKVYLKRLVDFLNSHHKDAFEINIVDKAETNLNVCGYSTLFAEDTLDLTKLLPEDDSNVKVVYLTKEKNPANEMYISKYQHLENIYKKMLCACEDNTRSDDKNILKEDKQADDIATFDEIVCEKTDNAYKYSRFDDFVLTTQHDENSTYRVYDIPCEALTDNIALGMLTNNEIQGIAPIIEGEECLKYDITDKINLLDFVTNNNKSGKYKLLKVFYNILETVFMLDEYMLDADMLVLNPKEIYVDENTQNVAVLYYPLQKEEEDTDIEAVLKDIIGIFNELLSVFPVNKDNDKIDDSTEKTNNVYYQIQDCDDKLCEEVEYGGTTVFPELQKAAQESLQMKNGTVVLTESEYAPHLIRRKTCEKIVIDKNIFKLGKDESYVDYCIRDNPTVSRNHADIIRKPDGFFLIDKGSLNHTFINGRRIEANVHEKLEHEDLIQIADEVFEFIK